MGNRARNFKLQKTLRTIAARLFVGGLRGFAHGPPRFLSNLLQVAVFFSRGNGTKETFIRAGNTYLRVHSKTRRDRGTRREV